jgi:hypothetical protein
MGATFPQHSSVSMDGANSDPAQGCPDVEQTDCSATDLDTSWATESAKIVHIESNRLQSNNAKRTTPNVSIGFDWQSS